MLDDAAEAVGGRACGGEAEGHRVALDVMRGAKQLAAGFVVESAAADCVPGIRQAVSLDHHPVLEFARQSLQRLFGAGHGIVAVVVGHAPQHLAQRIGLHDHVMRGVGLDLDIARFVRHDLSPA